MEFDKLASTPYFKFQIIRLILAGVKRSEIRKRLNFGNVSGVGEVAGMTDDMGKLSEQYIKEGVRVIGIWEKEFPKMLLEIADPPLLLFVKGNVKVLNMSCMAVVGSRSISQRGRSAVLKIIPTIIKRGIVVVSGLAIGTDTFVHETCLFHKGTTVAVLPSSIGEVYPIRNKGLAARIIDRGGCVISEYPLGAGIKRENFLERNRIVSGLCEGVIVTEAGKYSGSISTPNFAIDQGREVWCVSANTGDENSEGIRELIEDGATIIKI